MDKIPTAKELLAGTQIAVKDARTLVITTSGPLLRLLGILTEASFAIVKVAAAQAQGDTFAQKPVITRPFNVELFEVNKAAVLVRNAHY